MFEVFTNTSQVMAQNTAVVFDRQKFSDCRVRLSDQNNTITISTPGRYLIHFDGIAGSNTVDTAFSLQLYVNGVAQACARSTTITPVANNGTSIAFDTLIQVNNSCCCANNSQSLQIVATETNAGTLTHANVVIIHL